MGTTGNDTITATFTNEIFDGKGGNDTIIGGDGSDTYIFRPGYGQFTIENSSSGGTAPQGQLDFATGLDETDLWFVQSGNNLQIDVLGTQSSVTVEGWFGSNPSAPLAEIKGGNGLEIDSQLNQLIAAMATYESNNPGFNPVAAAQMPGDSALQSALASAWHH